MGVRRFAAGEDGVAHALADGEEIGESGWLWIDIDLSDGAEVAPSDIDRLVAEIDLDEMALGDAMGEENLPKVDDFGDHLLVVLHGISDERNPADDGGDEPFTFEIDCFLSAAALVTVHREPSQSLDVFARQIVKRRALSSGGPAEVLARIADVVSRRYLAVLDDLDVRVDDLTSMALGASPQYLEHLTVAREHVGDLRHVLRPQREVFDQLRRSPSTLLTDGARRRFSDVYDSADRSVRELETARSALSDTLGAYQGAEARKATEVTRVLTIYAAIMLPLSLIAGVFGMNFDDNPWAKSTVGFWIVMGVMVVVAVVSLALFAVAGWIHLPLSSVRARAMRPIRLSAPPVELAASLFQRTGKTLRPRRGRTSPN